jgi:hypothetical protein
MENPLALDKTPLDTDWDDIHKLFADMKGFFVQNPDYTLLGADDPGCTYQPPRIPRFGWVAYKPRPINLADGNSGGCIYGDDEMKAWTIPIAKLRPVLLSNDPKDEALAESFKTREGRQTLLEALRNSVTKPSTGASEAG